MHDSQSIYFNVEKLFLSVSLYVNIQNILKKYFDPFFLIFATLISFYSSFPLIPLFQQYKKNTDQRSKSSLKLMIKERNIFLIFSWVSSCLLCMEVLMFVCWSPFRIG